MIQPTTLRKIMRELGQLRSDPLEDIRVQMDEDDILQFTGIIAGPGMTFVPAALNWADEQFLIVIV